MPKHGPIGFEELFEGSDLSDVPDYSSSDETSDDETGYDQSEHWVSEDEKAQQSSDTFSDYGFEDGPRRRMFSKKSPSKKREKRERPEKGLYPGRAKAAQSISKRRRAAASVPEPELITDLRHAKRHYCQTHKRKVPDGYDCINKGIRGEVNFCLLPKHLSCSKDYWREKELEDRCRQICDVCRDRCERLWWSSHHNTAKSNANYCVRAAVARIYNRPPPLGHIEKDDIVFPELVGGVRDKRNKDSDLRLNGFLCNGEPIQVDGVYQRAFSKEEMDEIFALADKKPYNSGSESEREGEGADEDSQGREDDVTDDQSGRAGKERGTGLSDSEMSDSELSDVGESDGSEGSEGNARVKTLGGERRASRRSISLGNGAERLFLTESIKTLTDQSNLANPSRCP